MTKKPETAAAKSPHHQQSPLVTSPPSGQRPGEKADTRQTPETADAEPPGAVQADVAAFNQRLDLMCARERVDLADLGDERAELEAKLQHSPLFVATVAAVAGNLVAKISGAMPGKGSIVRTGLEWAIQAAIQAGRMAERAALEPSPDAQGEEEWIELKEGPRPDQVRQHGLKPGVVFHFADPLPADHPPTLMGIPIVFTEPSSNVDEAGVQSPPQRRSEGVG